MGSGATDAYRFGDLLALARRAWIEEMTEQLRRRGYADYRRTDAASLRALLREPLNVGALGEVLGVTRQAARKLAAGLEGRGLATTERDVLDRRRTTVVLTAKGRDYAGAILEVIAELNDDLASRVALEELQGADIVLRAVIGDGPFCALARRLATPRDLDGPGVTLRQPS